MKISLSNKRVQLCKHYNKNIYITSDHMKKNVLLNIIRKNFWKNVIFIVNFKFYVSTINGRSNLFNNIVKSMKTLLSMTKWDLKFWFDYYFSFSFTEIKYDQTNFVISSYIYISVTDQRSLSVHVKCRYVCTDDRCGRRIIPSIVIPFPPRYHSPKIFTAFYTRSVGFLGRLSLLCSILNIYSVRTNIRGYWYPPVLNTGGTVVLGS